MLIKEYLVKEELILRLSPYSSYVDIMNPPNNAWRLGMPPAISETLFI